MDIRELESFLHNATIPLIKKKAKTFLGISKQPHYENVWSNIYAFFFDLNGEHQFGDLFIKSLLQLINERSEFSFDLSYSIKTEVITKKGGRIDLLIYNSFEAIIIENKVYHILNNDLHDYWDSVNQEHKQGIVLSLKPVANINHPKFINITHFDLIQKVMSNFPSHFASANEKYIVFFKDFYQNILNLTNPMDKNNIQFYYQYETEITSLKKLRDTVVSHIKAQVEMAAEQIDGVELLSRNSKENEKRLRYYVCKENKSLMYTIVFDSLLKKEKELYIIVEIQGGLLKNKGLLSSVQFDDEELKIVKPDIQTNNNGYWLHIAMQKFVLKEENIEDLTGFICDTIKQTKLESIFEKVKTALVCRPN